jgi:multidrug transporter EmrE-like cation transporter
MLKSIGILGVYALVSSVGLGLLKHSLSKVGVGGSSVLGMLAGEWRFWCGVLLYGAGFLIWLALLRTHELSVIFPAAAGALVVSTALIGHYGMGEALTPRIVIGLALIVAGIWLVTSQIGQR